MAEQNTRSSQLYERLERRAFVVSCWMAWRDREQSLTTRMRNTILALSAFSYHTQIQYALLLPNQSKKISYILNVFLKKWAVKPVCPARLEKLFFLTLTSHRNQKGLLNKFNKYTYIIRVSFWITYVDTIAFLRWLPLGRRKLERKILCRL